MSCAGSAHMGRMRGLRAESVEILGCGEVAKGLMGSVVVVAMGEGVDEGLEFVDAVGEFEGGVELASPARLGALDASVEVGAFRGQDDEFKASS